MPSVYFFGLENLSGKITAEPALIPFLVKLHKFDMGSTYGREAFHEKGLILLILTPITEHQHGYMAIALPHTL